MSRMSRKYLRASSSIATPRFERRNRDESSGSTARPQGKANSNAMIEAIFFARFLPQEGTRVVHQSPPGIIVAEPNIVTQPLFSFETMSEYIIPRQAFCNRYVTIVSPDSKYQILGHPVCIFDEKYERNEFMFNFGIVIGVDVDKTPYEAVVRRLASMFTEMEIQNGYLSLEESESGRGRRSISALLEIIKEDVNNYNECMIPVDDANTINMKLFPIYTPPPPIKSWHVPIPKMKFSTIVDDTWDLTMARILPHIDGIKDVRRIAATSSTSLSLTKLALQHLLYYDSILLLPMFLFSAIYAPTPSLATFISSTPMQDECANYVYINGPRLSNYHLCRLFTTLCTSRTLKEWLKLHLDQGFAVLNFVDVRRFIQFGLIKGLIYRIHKYAVSARRIADIANGKSEVAKSVGDLRGYTDGTHCFDQVIVETNLGDVKIMDALRKFPKGDVEVLYR